MKYFVLVNLVSILFGLFMIVDYYNTSDWHKSSIGYKTSGAFYHSTRGGQTSNDDLNTIIYVDRREVWIDYKYLNDLKLEEPIEYKTTKWTNRIIGLRLHRPTENYPDFHVEIPVGSGIYRFGISYALGIILVGVFGIFLPVTDHKIYASAFGIMFSALIILAITFND